MTSLSSKTLPAEWYSGPARYARERREIFARSWQFATHESVLAAPGAYAATTIAGYPVLVVRDGAGALRGFHNVCRHRAGPLVEDAAGRCEGALTCRYHGWKYALDGRLISPRDFGPAADFDARDHGLFTLQAESWRGLVFVAIEPCAPLADLLQPVADRLGAADWSGLALGAVRTHLLRCNWKTYVENYLEGYHVPTLHPALDADIVSADYRVEVEGRIALHYAPPRGERGVYDGVWAWAWPNLGVNVYRRGLMIERIMPEGADATRLDYIYLTPGGEAPAAETLAMSDAVTAEDKRLVERVQQNLDAGIYRDGRLSPKHEAALAAFQHWVRAAMSETA